MTAEGFKEYIRSQIGKGIPFIAYWHPRGVGMMRTGLIEQPPITVYRVFFMDRKRPDTYSSLEAATSAANRARRNGEPVLRISEAEVPQKPVKAKRSEINAFRREISKLEKQTSILYTVEYDGNNVATTGGLEV